MGANGFAGEQQIRKLILTALGVVVPVGPVLFRV